MTAGEIDCDLLVIGSGAGGLSAAVTAAWHGLKVIVAEKEPVFGGTTAWSGGWMWAPLNPLAQRAGIIEDPEAPRAYLRHVLGNNFDEARVDRLPRGGTAHDRLLRDRTPPSSSRAATRYPTPTATPPAPGSAAARSSPHPTTRAGSGTSSPGCGGRCARRRSWA